MYWASCKDLELRKVNHHMIEFETDTPAEDILKGGPGAPAPGVYHCQVENATEHEAEGYIELKCLVCSPGPENGKTFNDRVYFMGRDPEKTATARKIALATAIRLGLTTLAAYEADKRAGRSHGIEWLDACGKQFIGDLKANEYTRQDGSKAQGVNASIYAIDDERAAKRCLAGGGFDLDLLSLVLPGGPVTAAPAAAPAATTSTTPPVAKNPPANALAQAKPAQQHSPQQQQQQSKPAAAPASIYDDI
jgi:hypothetical protein